MEVILKEDVVKLGSRGDVVKVAAGYGRNYLLPKKLAIEANAANKAVVAQMKASAVRRNAKEKAGAEELAKQIDAVVVNFTRKAGEGDQLFGSVTSSDIADAIWKARKIRVDRRKVSLDDAIKALGSYRVSIAVWGDVEATVKVMVVPGEAGEEGNVEAFEAEPDDY